MQWLLAFSFLLAVPRCRAQAHDAALSETEVESLRDAAYVPNDRVDAYIKILDTRSDRIHALVNGRRKPGREQQIHDLLDDFATLTDELDNKLDDYAPKHRDLRKTLPRLLQATERWSTVVRSAPEDPAYKVVQKIALDALGELHQAAATMTTEETAYFAAHPDAARAEQERADPRPAQRETIDIPR